MPAAAVHPVLPGAVLETASALHIVIGMGV
jgi:hypothetical protein